MEKTFILTFLLLVLASQLIAQDYQSSDNTTINFLRDIGESDSLINKIKKYNPDLEYELTFKVYVQLRSHYYYKDTVLYVHDSPFRMNLNYMCKRIAQDTIIEFLRPMLYDSPEIQEIEDSFRVYSRYAMDRFNSLYGLFLYNRACRWAYQRDTSSIRHKCEYLYAYMAEYVLYGNCKIFLYSKKYCEDCDDCKDKSTVCFPYNTGWWQNDSDWLKYCNNFTKRNDRENGANNPYVRYLSSVVDKLFCSERKMYIFSEDEKSAILQILDEGISQGSRECAYTKAFAQITGLVLNKDITSGKKSLIELMPSMSNSPFWEYVEDGAGIPEGDEWIRKRK